MAHALSITTELDNRTFVPGEEIRGEVKWEGGDYTESADGEIRLFFYTSGKGTRDVEVIKTIRLPGVGASGNRDFSFSIQENSPPSFSGKLVSVIWAIEFQIMGKSGTTERLDITVSPTGEELLLYKYDDGNLPKHSDFNIGKARKKKR